MPLKDIGLAVAYGMIIAFAIFGVMAIFGSPLGLSRMKKADRRKV
jgi:hypothetical protein